MKEKPGESAHSWGYVEKPTKYLSLASETQVLQKSSKTDTNHWLMYEIVETLFYN